MSIVRGTSRMTGCYVYVDGQYVRAELRKGKRSDEFDPMKPAAFVQNQRMEGTQLTATRIFYYDAIDEKADQEEQVKQNNYFARLRRLPDTHVVLGEVRKTAKAPRKQKGVDVQLAIDALRTAFSGNVRAIALVTGDADFAPLARAIRDAGPHVIVIAFEASLSESLRREADRVEILGGVPQDWELPPAG